MQITIVGSGVSGLTTAYRVLKQGLDCDIAIISTNPPPQTTSYTAAAFWYPYSIGGFYRRSWATDTLHHFIRCSTIDNSGVSLVDCYEYFEKDSHLKHALNAELAANSSGGDLWWSGLPEVAFKPLNSGATRPIPLNTPIYKFRKGNSRKTEYDTLAFTVGTRCKLPVIEPPLYLAWLENEIRNSDRTKIYYIPHELGSYEEAVDIVAKQTGLRTDLLVNCTGARAGLLIPDQTPEWRSEQRYAKPIAGDVVKVRHPIKLPLIFSHSLKSPLFNSYPFYVVPRPLESANYNGENVYIVGGSLSDINDLEDVPSGSSGVDRNIEQLIIDRLLAIFPEMDNMTVIESKRGYRPAFMNNGMFAQRGGLDNEKPDGVRVRQGSSKRFRDCPVFHNYGHGGAGYTLSWGTAGEVVRNIKNILHI